MHSTQTAALRPSRCACWAVPAGLVTPGRGGAGGRRSVPLRARGKSPYERAAHDADPGLTSTLKLFFAAVVLAGALYTALSVLGVTAKLQQRWARPRGPALHRAPRGPPDAPRYYVGTDADIWEQTQRDIQSSRPTFGLTRGAYAAEMPPSCHRKLISQCNWNVSVQGRPPVELLQPGALSLRTNLTEMSQCFIWYSGSFWTRATGGARGKLLARHGGQVGDAHSVPLSLLRAQRPTASDLSWVFCVI